MEKWLNYGAGNRSIVFFYVPNSKHFAILRKSGKIKSAILGNPLHAAEKFVLHRKFAAKSVFLHRKYK